MSDLAFENDRDAIGIVNPRPCPEGLPKGRLAIITIVTENLDELGGLTNWTIEEIVQVLHCRNADLQKARMQELERSREVTDLLLSLCRLPPEGTEVARHVLVGAIELMESAGGNLADVRAALKFERKGVTPTRELNKGNFGLAFAVAEASPAMSENRRRQLESNKRPA